MNADRWERIEHLCQEAIERPEDEQNAFLSAACANDVRLRREVESLLAYRKKADQFMEAPALDMAARELAADHSRGTSDASRMIGRLVSHYRVVEKVASGGMGDVYRAVRADGRYDKQVAIKLIQSGFSTGFFLARFQNETQILASLDNPNIARLLDGGATEEGLPYLVMEYIQGQPIDAYCFQQDLSLFDKLTLFRTVCSAVQYAHQNLVVHRDLKPGNILVTPEGIPKLLDFGIAKILDPLQHELQSEQTITMVGMLTPDYASPEQVRNERVTVSSDVYSLGVILYLLLTGCRPYRASTDSPQEIMKAICETEPEKPSTAVMRAGKSENGEARRHSGTAVANARPDDLRLKRRRALSGDLDTIVLKALRKEPERRYASVEQFSEDIRHHLAGLPVLAHGDTLGYRARKFIGRHKLGVGAAALLVLSLVGGMIATLWQARIAKFERARAERRFNDVRALANSLMFGVHDAIQNLPGATPARKLLVSDALHYLDSLAQEASGDLSLQGELASAYEKVGDVQSDPGGANLGDTAGAVASYRKALAIRESMAASSSISAEAQRSLAIDNQKVSNSLVAAGDYKSALEYARKALVILEPLAAKQQDAESQNGLAGAYYQMALCQADLGDFASALVSSQKSAAIREAITDGDPVLHARIQTRLAGTYGLIALIFARESKYIEAISAHRKANNILEQLLDSDAANAMYREYFYETYYYIGLWSESKDDFVEALKYYRRALPGFESLSSADPKEARTKRFVGKCERHIGATLVRSGEMARGFESIRKGLAIAQDLYRTDPVEKSDKLTDLADAYAAIGFAYSREASLRQMSIASRLVNWKAARAAYQKSLDNYLEAKRLGALSGFDRDEPGQIAHELAECDAALAKLRDSLRSN